MKKLIVINGPNLNMLGIREPEMYGNKTYKDMINYIKTVAKYSNVKVNILQTNYEGDIVSMIQDSFGKYDGIILNAGGYTHTSVAILDALKAVNIETIEVHLTDIKGREEFRKLSYVSKFASKTICGKGFEGYKEAIEYFAELDSKGKK